MLKPFLLTLILTLQRKDLKVLYVMKLCPFVLVSLIHYKVFNNSSHYMNVFLFTEIVCASMLKCQRLLDSPTDIKDDEALKRLHYINAFGLEKFCATMYRMPKVVEEHPNVRKTI